jgi:hypothetical protein
MQYESTLTLQSGMLEGVSFTILRMSFGRRMDLMRRVRDLSAQFEYEQAGGRTEDKIRASVLRAEIDELYLRWGLSSLRGLRIDGRDADIESLLSCGPEVLCQEIVAAIKRECALTPEDRKN